MSLVTVSAAETVTSKSACTKDYLVDYKNGQYGCYSTVAEVLGSSNFKDNEIVTLLKNKTFDGGISVNKDITLDLGGYTVTLADGKQVEVKDGANVTIKNGTIKTASQSSDKAMFTLTGNSNTVTFDKSLTVNASGMNDGTNAVIDANSATDKTVINIYGTWTGLKGELVDCGTGAEDVITLNATVESAKGLVGIDAGDSVVNVTGGSYTSKDENTFELKSGTLNISGGTILAKKGNAVYVTENSDRGANNVLKITNGTLKSDTTYALSFEKANKGNYSITNGSITSGKNLPAIEIIDWSFLKEHEKMITGGTFTKGIVGDVQVGTNDYEYASSATKILVGNATVLNG